MLTLLFKDDHYSSGSHHGHGYDHHESYPPHYNQPAHPYEHHHDVSLNSLLIPLTGVVLLGAATLFASNPVLLQLGVISGKRRRRSLGQWPVGSEQFQDVLLLERFISKVNQAVTNILSFKLSYLLLLMNVVDQVAYWY